MKRIGILSDTHGKWDDRFAVHFADCDEVWHAGDVGDYSIIERLADIVRRCGPSPAMPTEAWCVASAPSLTCLWRRT